MRDPGQSLLYKFHTLVCGIYTAENSRNSSFCLPIWPETEQNREWRETAAVQIRHIVQRSSQRMTAEQRKSSETHLGHRPNPAVKMRISHQISTARVTCAGSTCTSKSRSDDAAAWDTHKVAGAPPYYPTGFEDAVIC